MNYIKPTLYIMLGIGIILFAWWQDYHLWLEDHDAVLAALIQVIGLIVIGFQVNRWLADYNERKTAKLERYKLQRQIAEDLPRFTMFGIDSSIEYAVAKYVHVHSEDDQNLKGKASRDLQHFNKMRENQVYGLIGQKILCMTAYKNYKTYRLVHEMTETLLSFPKSIEEMTPSYEPTDSGLDNYKNDIRALLQPVQVNLNEIVQLMANELGEWISGKK